MKESIEKINERVEKCIVYPGSQVSPRQKYLTDLVDKYKQDVQELTKKLAYAQGMIGSTGMKLYGSEQPTLDREQSIKGMIEKDISSLVREG